MDLSFSPARATQGVEVCDHIDAAREALTKWRTKFDERLEALERALDDPGPELSAVVLDFARVAGEEAEAAAQHARLEAQQSARHETGRHAAEAESQALDALRDSLARAERESDELRRSLDDSTRARDESRRALDDSTRARDESRRALEDMRQKLDDARRAADEHQRAAADAASVRTERDAARQEAANLKSRLTAQLEQARDSSARAEAEVSTLRAQFDRAQEALEAQGRDLEMFRTRLKQAVREAEDRLRAQERDFEHERTRLGHVSDEAAARAAAAAAEAERAKADAGVAVRDLERVRPQLEAATARVFTLEQQIQTQARVIAELRRDLKAAASLPAPPAPVPAEPRAGTVTPEQKKPVLAAPPTPAPAAPVAPVPVAVSASRPATPAPVPIVPLIEVAPVALPKPELASAPVEVATPSDDRTGRDDRSTDEADLFERPPAEESAGVFTSVADALRAWASETDAQQPPGPPKEPVSKAVEPGTAVATSQPIEDTDLNNTRKAVRHDLSELRISVTLDNQPGTLVDLSASGAQVVTPAMLKPGRTLRVAFPALGPLATGRAKVAWSKLEPPAQGYSDLQYRAGLTFTRLEPHVIERVLAQEKP